MPVKTVTQVALCKMMRLGSRRIVKYVVISLVIIVLVNILCTLLNLCSSQQRIQVLNNGQPENDQALTDKGKKIFISSSDEVLHIGLVAMNHTSCRRASLLITSILMHRHNPIHLHILVTGKTKMILKTLFGSWYIPHLNATFYALDEVSTVSGRRGVRVRPRNISLDANNLKMLIPARMRASHVEKLVILEPNIVTTSDVGILWSNFKDMRNKKKSLGAVMDEENGCIDPRILLVNVTAVQKQRYSDIFGKMMADVPVQKIIPTWLLERHCIVFDESKCAEVVSLFTENITNTSEQLRSVLSFDSYDLQSLEEIVHDEIRSSGIWDWFSRSCSDMTKHPTYRIHPYFNEYSYTSSEAYDVAMVTQLSFDRLHMLKRLLKYWNGPLSAALYMEEHNLVELLELFQSTPLFQRDNVAIHVVYKKGNILYPINFLRNVAWNYSSTPYVFLNDVDLIPSVQIYTRLKRTLQPASLTNVALVVPAFQSHIKELEYPNSKDRLERYIYDKQVVPFKWDYHQLAHKATNYNKWLKVADPYTVKWTMYYEPYVVVQRNVTHYDERFAGYGQNKVSHIEELHAQEYNFFVLPDVFLVHYPHPASQDEVTFRGSVSRTRAPRSFPSNHYYWCIQQLQQDFHKDLLKKYGYAIPSILPSYSTMFAILVVSVLVGSLHALCCYYYRLTQSS